MKVRELIEDLQKVDPELEVVLCDPNNSYYRAHPSGEIEAWLSYGGDLDELGRIVKVYSIG